MTRCGGGWGSDHHEKAESGMTKRWKRHGLASEAEVTILQVRAASSQRQFNPVRWKGCATFRAAWETWYPCPGELWEGS
jgi:hypothetical protein